MNDQKPRETSRTWLSAVAAVGLLSMTVPSAGCGDGPICQAEILVVIRSPNGPVLTDANVDMAGVQTDVRLSSTAGEGNEIVLTVLDDAGAALGTATGTTDENGDLVLEDVSLPAGAVALRAELDAGECGSDEDEVSLDVVVGDGCELALGVEPLDNDFYAPLGVLNASLDGDAGEDDFQVAVDVTALPGAEVELFVLDAGGVEASLGTASADDGGVATFDVTLGQGRQSLRAVCGAVIQTPSVTTSVFVDTIAPSCAMEYPGAGSSITPGMDLDDDLSNGVQLTLTATAEGGDTVGEATEFVVTVDGASTTLAGTEVDVIEESSVDVTIDPADTPTTATIAFSTQDHAGNGCAVEEDYDVVFDGCDIAVTSPTSTVTVDADAGASGIQVDIGLAVSTACAGRTVASDCGLNNPTGVVAGDGTVSLRANWCVANVCDVSDDCVFSVTNTAGIDTSAGATLRFDNEAPIVSVDPVSPDVPCGSQIAPAQDLVTGTPGVQVRVRVISPVAASRNLGQTSGAGSQSYDASASGGEVVVTLESGLNTFVGTATDTSGNVGTSAACTLTLVEIAVGFSAPADDGVVGAGDGVVTGDDLTFTLCGTVSETGTSVGVAIDGGAAIPAVVTGATWCVPVTVAESPPVHSVVATATSGLRTGQATLALTVDLSAPDTIANLAVVSRTRRSLHATWTAPSDGGGAAASYLVKVSTIALTEGNFDVTGEEIAAPAPQAPGASEALAVLSRRAGTAYWLGVAAVDGGGNRGPAAIIGPVTPAFDATAAILPVDTVGSARLGDAVATGRFNDDAFDDVAIGAPYATAGSAARAGAVYVYFGSAAGIDSVPDVVITGLAVDGAFGSAVTAVRWSSATRDDLVIGEPYTDNVNGRIYVFEGGPTFVSGSVDSGAADVLIRVDGDANHFTGGGLGYRLASLDFDGDGFEDLAMASVIAGAGNGAVAILYGGTVTTTLIELSDLDASGMGGAVVHLIEDPVTTTYDIFAAQLFDVGPTMGSSDTTDDLVVDYADPSRSVLLVRGSTSRPTTPGVHDRPFTIGQDVRFEYSSADTTLEIGASVGSVSDVNGDGARDLVVGIPEDGANLGRVLILDGNATGTAGVASTATAGVVVTDLSPGTGMAFVGAGVVNNGEASGADIDGDGSEDLLLSARIGGTASLLVWFGGSVPVGAGSANTADLVISGPATFTGATPSNGGTNIVAKWAGDVNADGLPDIIWSDSTGNAADGSFQVLWDDGN
jgi:hypothetical protein